MWQIVAYTGIIGGGLVWMAIFVWGIVRLCKQRKNSRLVRQDRELVSGSKACPMCGAAVSPNARQCLACGEKLQWAAQAR